MQRRKAELTLAQIWKSYQTAGSIIIKFDTCANSHGNGYTPNKLLLDTRGGGGHLRGFRGSTIQQSGEAVRLAPTLVHVCGFIWEWYTSAEWT